MFNATPMNLDVQIEQAMEDFAFTKLNCVMEEMIVKMERTRARLHAMESDVI